MEERHKKVHIDEVAQKLSVDKEHVVNLIKDFLHGRHALELYKKAFHAGDKEECKVHIQSIKTLSSGIGLTGLAILANEIEIKLLKDIPLTLEMLNDVVELWNELANNFAEGI